MLMSSRQSGEDSWSQVYLIVESPTLHQLTTEIHAELSWPPSIGGSSGACITFSELSANTVRDGIIDVTLPKDIDSGSIWACITAQWKVNRGFWIIEDWQLKQIPDQYGMTMVTYVADMTKTLSQLQQNLLSLQQDYSSLQQSFNAIQANFNALQSTYATLQTNYQAVQSNFSTLQATYAALQATYNTLQTNYQAVQSNFSTLQATYAALQASYDMQTTNYGNLSKQFETLSAQNASLNASFTDLQSRYKELEQKYYQALQNQNIQSNDLRVQQLTILTIVSIIVAVASIITTAFIWHKKKQ
jgi:predicted nuclease with TOPRIM domain